MTMFRVKLVVQAFCLVCLFGSSLQADAPKTIAVLPTYVTDGADEDAVVRFSVADLLRDEIQRHLAESPAFQPLERDQLVMQLSLEEQKALAFYLFKTEDAEFESGTIIYPAEMVAVPIVRRFSTRSAFAAREDLPGYYDRTDSVYMEVALRVLDTKTLRIVPVEPETARYRRTLDAVRGRVGGLSQDTVDRLVKDTALKLARSLVAPVDVITVVAVSDNGEVYLNKGSDALEVGMLLDVFVRATADADEETHVATLEVIRVTSRSSVAQVISGDIEKIVRGAVARPVN